MHSPAYRCAVCGARRFSQFEAEYCALRDLEALMQEVPHRVYAKPRMARQERMVFPLRGVEDPDRALTCRQCSSCHGCR